jgi:hypothetical protein
VFSLAFGEVNALLSVKTSLIDMKIRKSIGTACTLLAISGIAFSGASLAAAQTDATQNIVNTPSASGPAAVGSTLEMHINNNGSVLVRGAKITSISGSTINATEAWGSFSVNWVINTTSSTKLQLRYGAAATFSEFSVGDYISFSGSMNTTQSTATVNANVVKDFSAQEAHASFSGTVSSVNSSNTSFVLATSAHGNVTVTVSPSTVIKHGSATSTFSTIATGQTISHTTGVWNNLTNTLQAEEVTIYVNQGLLNKRTFEGTLGALAGNTAPTTFTYTVGSTAFTVNVAANTTLLSNSWNPIQLSQMQGNDKVRIYGAVEANNTSTIDAYVVRDTNVK